MIDLLIKEAWYTIQRNFVKALKAYNISDAECYVILAIPKEGINATLIPQSVGLAKGSVSRTLNKLYSKGFISRNADSFDKRAAIIRLTDDGVIKRKEIKVLIVSYREFISLKVGEDVIGQIGEGLKLLVVETKKAATVNFGDD